MTATQEAILDAATRVITRDGAARLTLDAVAREAGVSKGGLLYHYPSKDALLMAALDAHLGAFEQALTAREATDPQPLGRFARANFTVTLDGDPQPDASAAVIGAIALNPNLLAPVRDRYAGWRARAEADGLPPGLGTLIALAADGLWLADLLGLGAPDDVTRAQVRDTVERLTRGDA